jgi:hypothetical protein
MKPESSSMTQKQNLKASKGKVQSKTEKSTMSRTKVKTELICFYDIKEIILMNMFLQNSQMSILHSNFETFKAMYLLKKTNLWPDKSILHLHHPSSHTALLLK